MSFRDRFTPYSADGDTIRFTTCLTCFARIGRVEEDMRGHDDWHKSIERNSAHPVTADRFSQRLQQLLESD